MKRVLLDASYAIALALEDDPKHAEAVSYQEQIFQNNWRLLVSTFVMDEVVTLLNTSGQHRKAVAIGDDFLSEPMFEFVHVGHELFDRAWNLFKRRADKTWSMTDCVSFELMKEQRVSHALTFDKHFAQAGFIMLPIPKA